MDAVVQLDGVTVIYGKNQALKNVSAKFAKGAVGLLGPNGAGKSTMLKALLGFVKPDQGRMTVLDMDVAQAPLAIRARIGYMPESDAHIPGMNAVSFVAYCGQLSGLPATDAMQRAHEVLYYVGLGEARYRNIETYSTGMKQRVKLAQALVHDPDLLLLDEPTNGLDPSARQRMLSLVREIAASGVRIVLSSHLLRDVESCCDSVIVLKDGKVATIADLASERASERRFLEIELRSDEATGPAGFSRALAELGCEVAELPNRKLKVVLPPVVDVRTLYRVAGEQKVQLRRLTSSRNSLELLFMKAMEEGGGANAGL